MGGERETVIAQKSSKDDIELYVNRTHPLTMVNG